MAAKRTRTSRSYQKKGFFGKNLPKGHRRPNGTGGSRIYYPYVKKDQEGTAMATLIRRMYSDLIDQFNSRNYSGKRSDPMPQPLSAGKLSSNWKKTIRQNLMPMVKDLMKKQHLNARGAKSKASDHFLVHFGADPASR